MPDYFRRKVDGTGMALDVRPHALVKPADREAIEATAAQYAPVAGSISGLAS